MKNTVVKDGDRPVVIQSLMDEVASIIASEDVGPMAARRTAETIFDLLEHRQILLVSKASSAPCKSR